MVATNYTSLTIGPAPDGINDMRRPIEQIVECTLSAAAPSVTVEIPAGSGLLFADVIASGATTSASGGSGVGINLFIGTSGAQARYASVTEVSGNAQKNFTLTQSSRTLADQTVVIAASASGSGAVILSGDLHVRLRYFTRIT